MGLLGLLGFSGGMGGFRSIVSIGLGLDDVLLYGNKYINIRGRVYFSSIHSFPGISSPLP